MALKLKCVGMHGLANQAGDQNCWMNSVTQCFGIGPLCAAVLKEPSAAAAEPSLLMELRRVFTAMKYSPDGVFELVTLRNLLGECLLAS